VIEIKLVGMYAAMLPAWLVAMGSAVKLPPPLLSCSRVARSRSQA
jgi:hypothetical protein